MNLIIFDEKNRVNFLPFTHTRPVADILCGIFTMRERWESAFKKNTSTTLTCEALQEAFPLETSLDNIFVNGSIAADYQLVKAITNLPINSQLLDTENRQIAFRTASIKGKENTIIKESYNFKSQTYNGSIMRLEEIWDIFGKNADFIGMDFELISTERKSQEIPSQVTTISQNKIFIEPGAKIAPCIINASGGPVYIGKDAEIMEGALIRGPFSLGAHSTVKMGAKIYGGTSLGRHCKVGGEVNNAVIFDYSNKGHDGFIGNAVIGSWCNLGADTNCSNLKNNYGEIKIWQEHCNKMVSTGLQFCGLFMGDHSNCSINTMFNTGTVVGVCCNIFGNGFPSKFIPSFTWGGINDNQPYQLDKAIETANRMMSRRGISLEKEQESVLKFLFQTKQQS